MNNKSCKLKMVFDTKIEAQNAALVANYQRGSKLTVYKCRYCALWHLASDYSLKDSD